MVTVEEKLPDFWKLSTTMASDLQTNNIANREQLGQHIQPLLEPSFIESMDNLIPGWKNIATLHGGITALHTLLVFVCCLNLPEYGQSDEQTRLEIEWAAVLHDLDKKLSRQDTAHPFRSAALSAPILPELEFKLLPHIDNSEIEAWSNLVMDAQRPDGERMLHDHSSLQEIISGIHQCWGNDSSASRILKAVLFHQSLPALKEWSNPVLLTDEELSYSLTLKDMEVLGPIMIADSDSWNIFNETRSAYLVEVRASNADTLRRIQSIGTI
jgi:hypothetical protein